MGLVVDFSAQLAANLLNVLKHVGIVCDDERIRCYEKSLRRTHMIDFE